MSSATIEQRREELDKRQRVLDRVEAMNPLMGGKMINLSADEDAMPVRISAAQRAEARESLVKLRQENSNDATKIRRCLLDAINGFLERIITGAREAQVKGNYEQAVASIGDLLARVDIFQEELASQNAINGDDAVKKLSAADEGSNPLLATAQSMYGK